MKYADAVGADRHDPDRREVDPRLQAVPAEDPQAEKRGLEEEGGKSFHRERRAEDVADVLGVRRPVHPELKLLDDARDDAEREVDQEQLAEEPRQSQPALVMSPVPGRLERRDEPDEPDRDRNEEEVVERRDGELPAGEVEGAHIRQAAQSSQNPHPWLLRITLAPMSVYRTPDERFADLPGYAYRAALPRAGRPAHALRRRGGGRPGAAAARRADLGVPLPQGDRRARRLGPLHRARLLRLRPLGQADRVRASTPTTAMSSRSRGSRRRSTCGTSRWSSRIGAARSASASRSRARSGSPASSC